ncbi:hypothetical protein [Paenibacillus sp. SN-8-1]|uniref:hypothetical protein n=1 Tax=Paenibacillus sp. SN-8-1 TaxID=3435409 RepID=UPI003D9A42D9
MVILLFGLNAKSDFIERNEVVLILIFTAMVVLLTAQILFFVVVCMIELTKFINNDSDFNSSMPKYQGGALIVLLILMLIVPSIIYGMFYELWVDYVSVVNQSELKMGMYDFIYFAFGINYSLPMSGTLIKLQDLINVNYYLRTVQIIHILSAKLLELILIGFIISKITKLLEKNREDFYVSEEIKRLYKLRNQKIITNEQYEQIKQSIINRIS